ncbi:plasmid mobilization relaxosome protein MobC [Streptomyces specialis]|uniref:plasmid mobilization relaxosome protein MobC n=1 Tax=Streptomyces specialis TaxID=498367 RepID=UPI00131D3C98|nr:plasmid mobilization relaxosome protein MobC [Streptomyces specialis]
MRAAVAAAEHRPQRRRKRLRKQRTQRITARFSAEEAAAIRHAAKGRGIAVARMIARATMADIDGTAAPAPERTTLDDLIDELAAARTQVSKIGGNLNQIAHRLNTGGALHAADQPVLHQVKAALAAVGHLLRAIDAAADRAASRTGR